MKKVSVEGVAIKDSNMKPRQCMAGRAAPSPQSFATIRAEAEPSTGDNVEPEASSDSKDDDRDRGDGNRNEGSPTVERNQTGSKAPLELLGTVGYLSIFPFNCTTFLNILAFKYSFRHRLQYIAVVSELLLLVHQSVI